MENTAAKGQELAMRMGRVLLENGAEIMRVQDTMQRVATAYGVENFSAFVLTNAIFISGSYDGLTDGSKIKFVPSFSIHFTKISEINQLSREITSGGLDVDEAHQRLDYIETIPYYRLWTRVLACAVATASFCFLFSGRWIDCLIAFFVGACVELFLNFALKNNISKFITNIVAAAITATMAIIFTLFTAEIGSELSIIITASILRLVPGMSMTVSIRDFFNGDYISGVIRLVDALSVGGCIAIGVGAVISVANLLLGGVAL